MERGRRAQKTVRADAGGDDADMDAPSQGSSASRVGSGHVSGRDGRIWWVMMCDDNHAWEAESLDVPEPPPEAVHCPVCGLEAVTARRELLADYVRICLVSAARVSDPVSGAISNEGQWYVEVQQSEGDGIIRSHRSWSWSGATERAGRFREMTWPEALNRWRRTIG